MAIWNFWSGLSTTPPTSSPIISFLNRSYTICHTPLMLPRAQIAGRIFTLRACLIAVKLLDFSLCKNSQIGLEGDLKGLGGNEWSKQRKEPHSLPLIAFSTEVSVYCLVSGSRESMVDLQCSGPQNPLITLFVFHVHRHLNVALLWCSAFSNQNSFFLLLWDSFCQWLSNRWLICCVLLRVKCVKNFRSADEFS